MGCHALGRRAVRARQRSPLVFRVTAVFQLCYCLANHPKACDGNTSPVFSHCSAMGGAQQGQLGTAPHVSAGGPLQGGRSHVTGSSSCWPGPPFSMGPLHMPVWAPRARWSQDGSTAHKAVALLGRQWRTLPSLLRTWAQKGSILFHLLLVKSSHRATQVPGDGTTGGMRIGKGGSGGHPASTQLRPVSISSDLSPGSCLLLLSFPLLLVAPIQSHFTLVPG